MTRPTTEQDSLYDNLEHMEMEQLLRNINAEDQKVPLAVAKEIVSIEKLSTAVYHQMKEGGRLFYIGSGTSGRLGIVDASECPPTYGVPHGLVVGIIAGGDGAIRKAVEQAEDDRHQAWKDLEKHEITPKDFVIGISASGKTPYVAGGLEDCKKNNVPTGSIACNRNSEIGTIAEHAVEVEVGPEFVTGSTRMKAGTAQKLILNMITTSVMIRLGKVKGNKMVDMQLTNAKLVERGTRMIMESTELDEDKARELLIQHGSVRKVIQSLEDPK